MAESPTLDPKSPYYLDPDYQSNENLPMAILSKDEDNYFIWKNDFILFLRSKNKIGFVDGTLEKPDPSSPLYEPWETCNARVKCWMMSSLSEGLRIYVSVSETAHKAWEYLRVIFVPSVDLKIYELRQRLAMLRQDGEPVGRYFAKFMRAWAELSEYDPVPECLCGGCNCEIAKRAKEAREKEQRYAFLMGLNKELSHVRTRIMLMNPPPSLHQAFVLLDQAESMLRSIIDHEMKNLGSSARLRNGPKMRDRESEREGEADRFAQRLQQCENTNYAHDESSYVSLASLFSGNPMKI